ncbi:MAG: glycosyltransferase [Patescibacteria group bacterium]
MPEDKFIIGMSNVSLDDHEDNLPFFLAFQRLATEQQGIRLLMTGNEAYVSKKVVQLFGKDTLLFCGWPEFETYNYLMSSCNVLVLPYPNIPRNAGRWPNKVGDYLSFNRPIITNPTGDLEHLFQNHKLGWLCDNTTEAYISLFKRLLGNPSDFNSDSFDSLRVAYEMLSFECRIKKMNAFFQSLLNEA